MAGYTRKFKYSIWKESRVWDGMEGVTESIIPLGRAGDVLQDGSKQSWPTGPNKTLFSLQYFIDICKDFHALSL